MELEGKGCVFVDDNPDNLAPAQDLGITTVHADGREGLASRLADLLELSQPFAPEPTP